MLLLALAIPQTSAAAEPEHEQPFEVWLVDQSNSPGRTYRGRISIFDGRDISGASAPAATPIAAIDLGAETAALCMAQT